LATTLTPYLGFTFCDIHSSKYKIYYVSDYSLPFSPDFTDITDPIEGHHGSYYYGTNINDYKRTLNLFIDGATENEIRSIQRWLKPDKIGKLIFDESPYKYIMVKIASKITLPFVPSIINGTNIYNGIFTIEVVAYDPYYYSLNNSIDAFNFESTPPWYYSSGILWSNMMPSVSILNFTSNKNIILYNGGNEFSKVNVQITGTWDSLTIANSTTGQTFTLSDNAISATFTVDANLGQVKIGNLLATLYHTGGFIELDGNGSIDHHENVPFANGSNIVTLSDTDIWESDVVGRYIFMAGYQFKILNRNSDTQITIASNFSGVSNLYNIAIVDANEISITGTNMNISALNFVYKYCYM